MFAFMMAAIATVSPIALDQYPNRAADQYEFKQEQYIQSDVHISFVFYNSYKELEAAYLAHSGKKKYLNAYSVIKGDHCTVHMVHPKVSYKPEIVGHEVLHCAMGEWH